MIWRISLVAESPLQWGRHPNLVKVDLDFGALSPGGPSARSRA